MNTPDILADYPLITAIDVQWGEQDAFQHVNATVYFRWFENARIEFLNQLDTQITMGHGELGPILASIKCDYKLQIKHPDKVLIGTRIGKVGRTSIQVLHTVFSQQHKAIAAEGDSTIVLFNYKTGKPQRVPDSIREQIEK